jgi:hypothetical protein
VEKKKKKPQREETVVIMNFDHQTAPKKPKLACLQKPMARLPFRSTTAPRPSIPTDTFQYQMKRTLLLEISLQPVLSTMYRGSGEMNRFRVAASQKHGNWCTTR